MRRKHLVAHRMKRRNGLTKQDPAAPKFAVTCSNETSLRLREAEPQNRW